MRTLNFERADQRLLDDVGLVVQELEEKAAIDPRGIMLVGAHCRNVLHQALGFTELPGVTDTHDVDLGLVLSDWRAFERVDDTFTATGGNGIRYMIAGIPVDVMPFGAAIEDPRGVTRPRAVDGDLIVFGFDRVFEESAEIVLVERGIRMRIATPVGYAILKLRAWTDRSSRGVWKDAKDMGVVLSWYEHSESVGDRVWDPDSELSDRYDWDPELVSAHLLGRDMRSMLSEADADDLASRVRASDIRRFVFEAGIDRLDEAGERGRRIVGALIAGLDGVEESDRS